jgi:hypothetical protein
MQAQKRKIFISLFVRNTIFWAVTPCILVKIQRCFIWIIYLHIRQATNNKEHNIVEDEGSTFIRNVDELLDYMAPHPRDTTEMQHICGTLSDSVSNSGYTASRNVTAGELWIGKDMGKEAVASLIPLRSWLGKGIGQDIKEEEDKEKEAKRKWRKRRKWRERRENGVRGED